MRNKLIATVSCASVLAAMPAFAQDSSTANSEEAKKTLDTVVVTGSRISRKDFVSASPIVTASPDAISDSGRVTMDDYLRDLPQFSPGQGDFSNDSNGGTAGRATLNLRGLGSQRNLVIMDGRRLMSSGTDGAIDINTIPSLAIGGIEVISGGASATYGSDALSGVVNFKTRTDLDGLEVTAQYSTPDQEGEETLTFGAAYGAEYANGAGSLLLSAEYVDRGGVLYRDREFFLNPTQSSFYPQGRWRSSGSAVAAALEAQGETLPAGFRAGFTSVNDDGTLFDQNTGIGYNGSTELPYVISDSGRIGFHGNYNNYLQVPLDRIALFGKTEYELGNGIELYAQGIYSSSEAMNIGSEPVTAGVWSINIPSTNPFYQANPYISTLPSVGAFQGRMAQAGPRTYKTEADTTQLLLGLKGSIGDLDLNWDVHASFGKSTNTDSTISGALSVSATQELLDAADGGESICAGGFNPFGGTQMYSPACLEYASRTPVNETELEQTLIEGVLEGKAFEMPAGEARFAVSAQYRENTYDYVPDDDIAANDLMSLAATLPTNGSIDVIEVGGELLLPLVSDAGVLQSLNATLGYRYSDYNLAGTNDTYKAEFDAQLGGMFIVRGGYQRAVRAPNVGEFFLSGLTRVTAIGNPPAGDPCDLRNSPSGDALALCAATGVPLTDDGTGSDYRAATGSIVATTIGNRDLEPETAETLTFGAVFTPPLNGSDLNISVDYYDISIEDAISAIGAADSLNKCYNRDGSNPTHDINNFFCGNVSRQAGIGSLLVVEQPIRNLGGLETSGIDFAIDWKVPVSALSWGGGEGSINFRTDINYLSKFEVATFAGDEFTDFSGTLSSELSEVFPELKALSSVQVETGPITFVGTWRYLSDMDDRSTASNPASEVEGVDAHNYFDLSARYAISDSIDLYGGINNVEDKEPPEVGGAPATTNQGIYDSIGRTFFLGAKARF